MLDGSSVSLTYFEERIWLFLSFCSNLRALKWKLFFLISAGFQGNNSLDVCIPSETVIIVVTLPMSKAEFFSDESTFISSVATAANCVPANVKILSVEETSTRAFRTVTARALLVNSVQVTTSILIYKEQQTPVIDQSFLNSELSKFGMPNGSVVFLNSSVPVLNSTVVMISTTALNGSGNGSTSNIPIGPIVGGILGLAVLVAGAAFIQRRNIKVCQVVDIALAVLEQILLHVADTRGEAKHYDSSFFFCYYYSGTLLFFSVHFAMNFTGTDLLVFSF